MGAPTSVQQTAFSSSPPPLTPLWKGGTPGNPFVDGDTVNPGYGEEAQVDLGVGESCTVNMPVMTVADAGKQVGVRNVDSAGDQDFLDLSIVPNGTDSIGGLGSGVTVTASATFKGAITAVGLVADGNGRWGAGHGGNFEDALFDVPGPPP